MDVTDFNQNYLNGLLDKISKKKISFLLGDFNINFLNYNENRPTNYFLDSIASSSLLPYILQPSWLTGHSKTLVDNIFCNLTSHEVVSVNVTAPISDHLPQFLIAPSVLFKSRKIFSWLLLYWLKSPSKNWTQEYQFLPWNLPRKNHLPSWYPYPS